MRPTFSDFWHFHFDIWIIDASFLQVLTCGFPPLEDRDKSLKLLAGHDYFGGGTFTKEETVSLIFFSFYSVVTYLLLLQNLKVVW